MYVEYENLSVPLKIGETIDIIKQLDKYINKESRRSVHYMKTDTKEVEQLEYEDRKGIRMNHVSVEEILLEVNKNCYGKKKFCESNKLTDKKQLQSKN